MNEAQSNILSDRLEALQKTDEAAAATIRQVLIAMNEQRAILNAVVLTLKEQGIEVDVPELDEN